MSTNNNKKQKPNNIFLIPLAIVSILMCVALFRAQYTYVDGKLVTNTPLPPSPTFTPYFFSVTAKVIGQPEDVGSEFSGFYTWVQVVILQVDSGRNINIGDQFRIRFRSEKIAVQGGQKLQLQCSGFWEKELKCNDEYDLVK